MMSSTDHTLFETLQANGDLRADSRVPQQSERQRGLRSFLTWSFFLGQIAAAEAFFGDAAKAATAESDRSPARSDNIDDASPQASGSMTSVNAAGDPALNSPPDQIHAGEIQAAAAAPQQSAVEDANAAAASEGGGTISAAAGGAAGEAGQASENGAAPGALNPLTQDTGLGIELGEIVDLDSAVPALLGDTLGSVVQLLDGTLDELTSAPVLGELTAGVDQVLSSLTSLDVLSLEGNGGFGELFPVEPVGGAHLMQFANTAQDALSAPFSAGLGLSVHYSDLALSLSTDADADAASPVQPAGSLLLSLPVIGDVLGIGPVDAEIADVSSTEDAASATVQVTDPIDMAKGHADLWS